MNKPNNLFSTLDNLLQQLAFPAAMIDKEAVILTCNSVFLELYKLDKAACLNRNYYELCKPNQVEVPWQVQLGSHITKHTALSGDYTAIQWTLSAVKLGQDVSTKEIAVQILIGSDVTLLMKRAENNNTLIESLIDYIPAQVFWKDTQLRYLGCNRAFINSIGLKSKSDIVGKTDMDLPVDKNDSLAYQKDDLEIIRTKIGKFNIEEKQLLHNGEMHILSTNKVPLFNQSGLVCGVLGVYIDISHLKKIEQSLTLAKEAANRAKTEFIANMSHDIRTPLTGVIGVSDILEKLEDNPELKQYAHDIHDCGQQLIEMLNSILDVVSADNMSEQDKVLEAFDLRRLVQDVVNLEKPAIELKNIDLVLEVDASIPDYLINDKTKLHRILLNLFGNAVKFTDEGSISLSVQLLGREDSEALLRFSVIDTGVGISKEQQAKVFDRFFRGSPSYKGRYSGYGIGLHVAQSYAKLLGGEIKLESQEGEGATFYVDLVFLIPSEKNAMKSAPVPGENPEFNSKIEARALTCLLVEDNPVALKVLESIMTNAKVRYASKMDGESALQIATSQPFDFIITDIGLPGLSGNEFAMQYRRWERQQSKSPIPIIALTAHAKDDVNKACMQSGINEVFSKPFSSDMLLHILKMTKQFDRYSPSMPGDGGKLGVDLPDTEEQLFQLDPLSLFDVEKALAFMGQNKTLLTEVVKVMVMQEIPVEINKFETAHQSKDWDTIEKLAHKMKGGAVYVGTEKLKFACQYLERYKKAGHTQLLDALYQQMMQVIKQTCESLFNYLENRDL